ncbi:MAG: SPOR domain-containing protein [Syntrophobacteraceae bacterium]
MAKKLIVQRNLGKVRGSGATTRKYLWIVLVVLAFIVIITPYLLREKSRKEGRNGAAVEHGAITKEMPKPAQRQPGPATSQASTSGTTSPAPMASEAAKPQQAQPVPVPGPGEGVAAQQQTVPAQEQPTSQPAQNAESVSAQPPAPQPQPGQPATGVAPQQQPTSTTQALPRSSQEQVAAPQPEAAPQAVTEPYPAVPVKAKPPVAQLEKPKEAHKVLIPKKTNHCKHNASAQSKNGHENGVKIYRTTFSGSATHNKASQSPKPAVRPKTGAGYAVQVGSVYTSVSQAQLLQKKLAAKGYRASIHRVACSGFLVVTTPSSKSNAYTLREQMSADGLKKTKVVPTAPVSAGPGRK